MIRSSIVTLVLIFLLADLPAQRYFTVTAKSGLSLRAKPSLDASKLGRLDFLETIEFLEKSGKADVIKDGKENVLGEWYKVNTKGQISGYAFSAYLLESALVPQEDENLFCDPHGEPCQSEIKSKHCDLIIYNYQLEAQVSQEWKDDTLMVHEYVFHEISNHVMEVQPRPGIDSVQVRFTSLEKIRPAYSRWVDGTKDAQSHHFSWEGKKPYQQMTNSNGFARVPLVDYWKMYEYRRNQFGMRDTNLSSEGGTHCNLILEDHYLFYTIPKVLMHITAFKNGKALDPQLIEIMLSYGC